jgi:hypothetical protein
LQKNTKLYGPMNALDVENCSSSWNSEGNNQTETFLTVRFGRRVVPSAVKLQFQAGFAAESCHVYDVESKTLLDELEWDDIHELQSRQLDSQQDGNISVNSLKLVFNDFCDLYGRIILYRLEIWGHNACHNNAEY